VGIAEGGVGDLSFRFKFEIIHSGSEVRETHSEVTVALWRLGVVKSGAIWPTLRTTGLKKWDRTGETKVKQSLFSPVTAS